jgi:23S rRNA (guanosine2251-2'-O)-methyltransferase
MTGVPKVTARKAIFIFGVNPVAERLRHAPAEVYEVLVAAGTSHNALRAIAREAERFGLPVRFVDSALLSRLSASGKHQGVVAKVADYAYYRLQDVLQDLLVPGAPDWILALDGVTDPRNLGALLRTAEGVGIRHVVIPKDRAVGVTPAVEKSAVGAVSHLRICRVTNLQRALIALKEHGFWVVGLDTDAPQVIYGQTYPEKLVIVLGAEGAGLRPLIRRECDLLVSIPMRGQIDSLNVAVAAGVFLYEVLRQQDFRKAGATSHGG